MISDALPGTWSFDPWMLLALTSAGFVYLRGFVALRGEHRDRFGPGRAAAFVAGLAVVFVAVASPLDALADLLLQAHMVQHWLLMMVAPPLIWLGAPAVPLLRGLPAGWLHDGLGPLLARPLVRRSLRGAVHPAFATGLLAIVVIVWHVPDAYELALRSTFWHDVEHACFFWSALLFWHPVLAPWPSRRVLPPVAVLMQLVAFMLFGGVFSAIFAFSTRVIYPAYASAPRLAGVSAIADQNAAGAFMWLAGSLPMLIAAFILLVSWLGAPSGSRQSRARPAPRAAPRSRGIGHRLVALGLAQRAARIALLGLALVVVIDGWLGPQQPSALNLAGVLPWTYWRPLVVLGLLLAGNLFCGVCPIISTRDIAGRLLGRPLRWPRRLRGRWIAAAVFAAYLWCYEMFALWDSPAWTAWVVVGYFGVAFVVEGVFSRGTFCRHVCPIGQFQFVGSLVSPRNIEAVDGSVCARCSTRDCVRGNDVQPGCPTGLAIPTKASGLDCTLCLDCARACPHDNVGWLSVPRGEGLGVGRTMGSLPNVDVTAMVGLFVFGAFVNAAAMVAPVVDLRASLTDTMGDGFAAVVWGLGLALALVAVPIGFVLPTAWASALSDSALLGPRRLAARYLPALVPLAVAMWGAHFAMHWLAGPLSFVPAASRALAAPGSGPGAPTGWAGVGTAMMPATAFAPEVWLLGVGLFASVAVLWRQARESGGPSTGALRIVWPWALLAVLLHGAGVWILTRPMAMRGMLM